MPWSNEQDFVTFGKVIFKFPKSAKMETEMDQATRFLNPPSVKRVRYQRNFINTAVCELRFPTLLELETNPPRGFQSRLRKSYPFYEAQTVQQIGGPEGVLPEHHYVFRSKDQHWTVALKSFSLAVETSKYVDFGDFFSRFWEVLQSARDLIDSDFFTRVGLRYVNAIPLDDEDLDGWIRSELVSPITGGVLGTTRSFSSVVQGYLERGQYSFRHGLKIDHGDNKKDVPRYSLDFDYFKDNVEIGEVDSLVKYFNTINFGFFSWCLGEKAKRVLGDGKPK